MAINLPSEYMLCINSTVDEDYGLLYDEADDGTLYSRDVFSEVMYTINASWENIEATESASLRSFLKTYRNSYINVPVGSEVYKCRITGFPKRVWSGGTMESVTATFRGTLV